MGRPADSNSTTDESLTVRDNRTGKTYNVPYVTLQRKVGGQTKTKVQDQG